MTIHSAFKFRDQPVYLAASIVVILWGINQAQSVIVLLIVSLFLAVIGSAPVQWLGRKRVPRVLAVLIVVAGMIVLLTGIGAVVGASLNGFFSQLPFYQMRLREMFLSCQGLLASRGIVVTPDVLRGYFNPAAVINMTASLFTALSSALSGTLLVLFTVVFVLLESTSLSAKLRSLLDNPRADFPNYRRFVADIKKYVVIKTVINLIGGILIAAWLYVLGVDYPILWGFLAFLLHYIPTVGSILAAVPAVLLALIQLGGGAAALTGGGYLVIGMVLGNVVEPKIMGRRLGLSTLVVFVSLIFWGTLLGVVGALLCVPLTMTVKLACEANEQTRWLGVLLGPSPPSPGPGDTAVT